MILWNGVFSHRHQGAKRPKVVTYAWGFSPILRSRRSLAGACCAQRRPEVQR